MDCLRQPLNFNVSPPLKAAMELKEFISKTLQEVLLGINEAQNELAGKNPGTVVPFTLEGHGILKPTKISPYQNIKFEVGVNIEEKSGSGASIRRVERFH